MRFATLMFSRRSHWLALGTFALIAGCSKGDARPDSATPAPMAVAPNETTTPHDTMAGMQGMSNMQGMSMTGDPDRDFLRMMSDHHKGMILMAHMTKDRKPSGRSTADASKLDSKQDKELDQMQTMLEKDFKDAYAPKVMPDNQAMADELKGKSGADYDRTFYQNVVKHHQQAIKMIDEYLPKGKNAAIKQMAEKMKADQTKEIAEFQQKADQAK